MEYIDCETREQLVATAEENGYTLRDGVIQDPGQSEGEDVSILYFDDALGNGCSDEEYSYGDSEGSAWFDMRGDSDYQEIAGYPTDGPVLAAFACLSWNTQGFNRLTFYNYANSVVERGLHAKWQGAWYAEEES